MNIALLEKYNIVFEFTDEFGSFMPQAYGSTVADFLSDVTSSRQTDRYLLKTSLYLSGGISAEGDNALLPNFYGARIFEGQVFVFINHPDYPDDLAELPLMDFHEILEMWRDFLIHCGL